MKTGFIYWNPIIYRYAIRFFLYGKSFYSRYETIAGLLPDNASVIDVCCGDCYINKFLAKKKIDYLGLDLNRNFVKCALKRGIKAQLFNLQKSSSMPRADYVIIQGSLYHFMPNHRPIIDKLLYAARKALIISEPVRHMATSRNPVVASLSNLATRVNGNNFPCRFTKMELLDLFNEYNASVIKEINGGMDLIGLFRKGGEG